LYCGLERTALPYARDAERSAAALIAAAFFDAMIELPPMDKDNTASVFYLA
jgi:hypothetical protein